MAAIPPLASLVMEDLRANPGPTLAAALAALEADPADAEAHLAACLASLLAGEPKRALSLLASSPHTPRVTAALTAWAQQLDINRYPGDVGAETARVDKASFVAPGTGSPVEELVEYLAAYGPTGMYTQRTLVESSLREGSAPAVQEAFAEGYRRLNELATWAEPRGESAIRCWALVAYADLLHRAGDAGATEAIAQARQYAVDGEHVAFTFLVEGDWYAAPGSSIEAMGLDLGVQGKPSPLDAARWDRASDLWEQAADLVADSTGECVRLRAALSLRRALVAQVSGAADARRHELEASLAGYQASGDGAGAALVAVHGFLADIDDGAIAIHATQLGGGWSPPSSGPIADVITWAQTVGSLSWAVGLGRLLERRAGLWKAGGDATRARIALLAARALIALDPSVPSRTLITALASADAATNLSVRALLRLEREFGAALADATPVTSLEFFEEYAAALVMTNALRARARSPGAALAADRIDLLGSELMAGYEAMLAAVPAIEGPVPSTMEELQAVIAKAQEAGTLEALAGVMAIAEPLMQHMQLRWVAQHVSTLGVLAALARGTAAQNAGRPDERQRWFGVAVDRARVPGVEAFLEPLALVTAGRKAEARAVLEKAHASGTVADEFLLVLALRAGDPESASAAMKRIIASGGTLDTWQDLGAQAEVHLALEDAARALDMAMAGIAAFEASVALLVRDPDRVDACDQPDVAALYVLAARATLDMTTLGAPEAAERALEIVERVRSLAAPEAVASSADAATLGAWRRHAAEYAATANSLLARLAEASQDEIVKGYEMLAACDAALAGSESALEDADPGFLVRRAAPGAAPHVSAIRATLPASTVILDYVAVGDDLLGFAVTAAGVRATYTGVDGRGLVDEIRRFHASCAAGRAADSSLSELLLGPFAEDIRGHERVIFVPFGPLAALPFHALMFDGQPLGLGRVVSYQHRLAYGEHTDAAVTHERTLVVGDPAFDANLRSPLLRLPGARVEALTVASTLAVPPESVLTDHAATEDAVVNAADVCELLHISSHGHLDDLSPFSSCLVLAGTDELTVADLAGSTLPTGLAVLTGCDTGRGSATLGGDVVGLTRALLRSGVRRTIVSLWPVDDSVAPVLMQGFYKRIGAGEAPAFALAGAQRELAAMTAEQLREAYVALGGGEESTDAGRGGSLRRGGASDLGLDAELLDDEDLPEPLAGSAERYWAPFVLVT